MSHTQTHVSHLSDSLLSAANTIHVSLSLSRDISDRSQRRLMTTDHNHTYTQTAVCGERARLTTAADRAASDVRY